MSQSGGRVPRHKGTGVSVAVARYERLPVGLAAGYRKGRIDTFAERLVEKWLLLRERFQRTRRVGRKEKKEVFN